MAGSVTQDPPATPGVFAIILAGGASTRMGVDKASLVVDGMAMLERVMVAVSGAGVEHTVVVGPGHLPDAVPAGLRADKTAPGGRRLGPLAGIVGGWKALQRLRADLVPELTPDSNPDGLSVAEPGPTRHDPRILVVACDLPAIRTSAVTAVLHGSWGHVHGAVAHDGERLQPLLAAFSPVALQELSTAFDRGERSVRACWDDWDLGHVAVERSWIADADTPQDLAGFDVSWPADHHGE